MVLHQLPLITWMCKWVVRVRVHVVVRVVVHVVALRWISFFQHSNLWPSSRETNDWPLHYMYAPEWSWGNVLHEHKHLPCCTRRTCLHKHCWKLFSVFVWGGQNLQLGWNAILGTTQMCSMCNVMYHAVHQNGAPVEQQMSTTVAYLEVPQVVPGVINRYNYFQALQFLTWMWSQQLADYILLHAKLKQHATLRAICTTLVI